MTTPARWRRFANPYRDLGTCIDCAPRGGLHDPARCPMLPGAIHEAQTNVRIWQERLDRLLATATRCTPQDPS